MRSYVIGFKDVLRKVSELWKARKDDVMENASYVVEQLKEQAYTSDHSTSIDLFREV